jgi:hypothetical protein
MKKDIETTVVSGFPGVGKSYYVNYGEGNDYMPQGFAIDSDSSKFSKDNFPNNYIDHIKSHIGKVKVIFVSSHKEVRDALVKNDIKFILAYPNINLKDEYIERYKARGSDEGFINFISDNWESFIKDLRYQRGCNHLVLNKNEFLYNSLKLKNE